ncbi:MAG: hypothetical protein BRC29_00800 [Nanohaloarchaea archaeon SW_7_43_1]|nr:MAG: hypothetical protein BRC29_00800 [Nanohaloarchaea archaeon SW_7_43_1]
MKFPEPLNPNIQKKDMSAERYSRAGNSYLFTDDRMVILKSGNRYSIDFSKIGEKTVVKTNTERNSDLNSYVLDAEYYRLLREEISLSHFSTFSDSENAYVLTGPPNTGKTGINLALNLRGFKFMADEDAPVNSSGEAIPLRMPLYIGNHNIEKFQSLLNNLNADYSKPKAKSFRQIRKLPLPIVGKALDRFIEPVKIDPYDMNFETEKREIDTAFYIQPEKRNDMRLENMRKEDFIHKMVLWNQMQRSGFEENYNIWRTEFEEANEYMEDSEAKNREILEDCFESVKIKKLRVPLERQPRKIASFIEDKV